MLLASNLLIVIIGNEYSRNAARGLEEYIANEGVPPRGDQVPHLKKEVNDDQAPVDSPPFTYGAMRVALFQIAQAITTQEQDATTQAQSMWPKLFGRLYPEQTNKCYDVQVSKGFHYDESPYFSMGP